MEYSVDDVILFSSDLKGFQQKYSVQTVFNTRKKTKLLINKPPYGFPLLKYIYLSQQLHILGKTNIRNFEGCCNRTYGIARHHSTCIHNILRRSTPFNQQDKNTKISSKNIGLDALIDQENMTNILEKVGGSFPYIDSPSQPNVLSGIFSKFCHKIVSIIVSTNIASKSKRGYKLSSNVEVDIVSFLDSNRAELNLGLSERQQMGFSLISQLFVSLGLFSVDFENIIDTIPLGLLLFYILSDHSKFVQDNKSSNYSTFEHPSIQLSFWYLFAFLSGDFGHSFNRWEKLPISKLKEHASFLETVVNKIESDCSVTENDSNKFQIEFNKDIFEYLNILKNVNNWDNYTASHKKLDTLYNKIIPYYRLYQFKSILGVFYTVISDFKTATEYFPTTSYLITDDIQVKDDISFYNVLHGDKYDLNKLLDLIIEDTLLSSVPITLYLLIIDKHKDDILLITYLVCGICLSFNIVPSTLYLTNASYFTLFNYPSEEVINGICTFINKYIDRMKYHIDKDLVPSTIISNFISKKLYLIDNNMENIFSSFWNVTNIFRLEERFDPNTNKDEIYEELIRFSVLSFIRDLCTLSTEWCNQINSKIDMFELFNMDTDLITDNQNYISTTVLDKLSEIWSREDLVQRLQNDIIEQSLLKDICLDLLSKVLRKPDEAKSVIQVLSILQMDNDARQIFDYLQLLTTITSISDLETLSFILSHPLASILTDELIIFIIQKMVTIGPLSNSRILISDCAARHLSNSNIMLFCICTSIGGILLLIEEFNLKSADKEFLDGFKQGKPLSTLLNLDILDSSAINVILSCVEYPKVFKESFDIVFKSIQLLPCIHDLVLRYIVYRLLNILQKDHKLFTSPIMFLHDSFPKGSKSVKRNIESCEVRLKNSQEGVGLDPHTMYLVLLLRFQLRRSDLLEAIIEILENWDFIPIKDRLSLQLFSLSLRSENFVLWNNIVAPELLQICRLLVSLDDFESCTILAEKVANVSWSNIRNNSKSIVDIGTIYPGMMRLLTDHDQPNSILCKIAFDISEYCIEQLIFQILLDEDLNKSESLNKLIKCLQYNPELLEMAVDISRTAPTIPNSKIEPNKTNFNKDMKSTFIANTLIEKSISIKRMKKRLVQWNSLRQAKDILRELTCKYSISSSISMIGIDFSAEQIQLKSLLL